MQTNTDPLALRFAQSTELFFALGEVPRQQIIMLLNEVQFLNVGQIADLLPLSRPAISHHLKVLRQAGLVVTEKRGTESLYTLSVKEGVDTLKLFVQQLERCV
jgi:DNA-binding transcriptional ArsR family regulator